MRPLLAVLIGLVAAAVGVTLLPAAGETRHGRAPAGVAWQEAFTPVADTWIEVPYPTDIGAQPNATPHGADVALEAGGWDYGVKQRTLMRFDVPTTIPDTKLERAELELAVTSATIGVFEPPAVTSGTIRLSLRPVTSTWDEATMTGEDPVMVTVPVVIADVAWGPCQGGRCGTARIDALPLVRQWEFTGPFNHGVVIDARGVINRSSTGTSFVVGSRESRTAPTLRLEYSAVPFDLPDLRGTGDFDCGRQGAALRITNGGLSGAGPFRVASTLGASWPVDGLAADATTTIFDPGSVLRSYRIDPDDAVEESNEDNNEIRVAIPACGTPVPLSRIFLPLAQRLR
jgi:hypothetical protein